MAHLLPLGGRWPAEVWLNLQGHYDRQLAEAEMKATLARIKPCALLE